MRKITTTIIFMFAALFATGCQTLGPSAEQIKEMSATSSAFCTEVGPGLYTPAVVSAYASFGGKSVGTAGGGGVVTCGKFSVDFNNEGRATNQPTVSVSPLGVTTITPPPAPNPYIRRDLFGRPIFDPPPLQPLPR